MTTQQIDPGIADAVRFLNANGFSTFGSCEGGTDHLSDLPTIQVAVHGDLDAERNRLCRFLLECGVTGFTVRTVSMHQRSERPEPFSYIEFEAWSHETLRYLTF